MLIQISAQVFLTCITLMPLGASVRMPSNQCSNRLLYSAGGCYRSAWGLKYVSNWYLNLIDSAEEGSWSQGPHVAPNAPLPTITDISNEV